MGMYDSLYDELGYEWQTKALDQVLAILAAAEHMERNL